jgi:hypothetical protein
MENNNNFVDEVQFTLMPSYNDELGTESEMSTLPIDLTIDGIVNDVAPEVVVLDSMLSKYQIESSNRPYEGLLGSEVDTIKRFKDASPDTVLGRRFNMSITKEQLSRLDDSGWISCDVSISIYLLA